MKMDAEIKLNLKTEEAIEKVTKASRLGMRDITVNVWHDVVANAPWKRISPQISTGHNRRSIAAEVSKMGVVMKGIDAEPQKSVDDSKIEGAVYSTSGYGGYLETGTWKMAARPYFKPALDRNFTKEKFVERTKSHLE